MTKTETVFKINDVYDFRFKPEVHKAMFDPYHCFDGQLIVRDRGGELVLQDTFWGSGDNKTFTIEKALEKGELTLKCNLDEIESISKDDLKYYADEDVFNLSTQHGCRPSYYKRRGAGRSKEKMLSVINEQIDIKQSEIKYAAASIERLKEAAAKVEAGDTTIYF